MGKKIRTETIHYGVDPDVTMVQLMTQYTKTQHLFFKIINHF